MQRDRSASNYLINVAGLVLPLLVMVLTIPLYLRTVGDQRYGVLALVWLLLGYAGFLDLGLTRACENALARATQAERAGILVTAVVLNLVLGLIGAVILFFLGDYLFTQIITAPAALHGEIRSVIPWVAALFPLGLVSGVVGGALDSRERFLAANALSISGTLFGQIVPVICAVAISPELTTVVPAAVMARAAAIAVSLSFVYWQDRPLHFRDFRYPTARRLMGYGGWITISSLVSPLLVSLDQFVIGSRLGLAAVPYYAIPTSLVSRGQIFAAALSRTLFPRFSRLEADEARQLGIQATRTLIIGFAAICAPAILVIPSVLTIWMGRDFALAAAPVAQILLIGGWLNGVAFIPFGYLQAQGRPDLTAKFHLAEIVPFVAILWFATAHYGLIGAAAAWTLRVAVDAALMIGAARFGFVTARGLLIPGACMLVCYALATWMRPAPTEAWLLALGFGLALVAFGLVVDPTIRRFAQQAWRPVLTFRKVKPCP